MKNNGTLRFLLLNAIFVLLSFNGFGQGSEDFSNIPASSPTYASRSWTGTDGGTWGATLARTDQTLTGKAICTNGSGTVTSPTYPNGVGTLTFDFVRAFTGIGARSFTVWINGVQFGGTTTVSATSNVVQNYSQAINISGNIIIEIRTAGAQIKIDNISWTAASTSPTITASPTTLSSFTYVVGSGPSQILSFTTSGSNLTNDIIITAPTNYEISTSSGGTYLTSLTLTQVSGTVAATPTFVRLVSGLSVNTYTGSIGLTSTGATSLTVTLNGSVTGSAATDIISAGGESATISSIINTTGPLTSVQGTQVWQFTIRDGGAGLNDADNLPSILTALTFSQAGGDAIGDWSQTIQAIDLFDGATNVGSGTVTANQVQFTGLTISVADNTQKTISVRLTLKCPVGAGALDGEDFGFQISNANATFSPTGSNKSAFSAITSTNGQNAVSVVATQLTFLQQPSNTGLSSAMSPTVTVIATDVCGNTDTGFTGSVSLNSTGTMTGEPLTVSAVAGVASFGGLIHTVVGSSLTLSATATGLTGATSSTFEITNATTFKPGDLVFIGFDAQEFASGAEDGIYIMTMVDIVPGTTFLYINSRFEAGAAACTRTMRWGGPGDNPDVDPGFITITLNGGGNILAGSIIKFIEDGSFPNSNISSILVNGSNRTADFTATGTGGANLTTAGTDGDQLWLAQGSFSGLGTANVQFSGQVLYGLTNGPNWVAFSSACSSTNGGGTARQSRLHPDLECFNYQSATRQSGSYYNTAATHTGTKRTLLAAIANIANWTNNATIPAARATTTFTVNASNPAGTWVGGAAGAVNDWFNCNNWEGSAVPDKDLDVLIPNVTDFARIDVDGYAIGGCAGTFTSDKYKVGGVRLAACKSLTIDGETLEFGNGSSNSGDVADRLDIFGDLTINNTVNGSLDMDAGTSLQDGTINLQGNWTNNLSETAFAQGNGTINFVQSLSQTVNTNSFNEVFANIGVNKTGGSVTLNYTSEVEQVASYTTGLINSTLTNLLIFRDGATAVGASNISFTNGPVRKIGNDAFTFPIGKTSVYAPAGITAPGVVTDHFTAEYFDVNPHPTYDNTLKDITIDHLSICEHWIINRTNGTSNVSVDLSWNTPRSCGVTTLADLLVARWDGTMWKDHGNGGTTGNTTTGTIVTSAAVSAFSPFTLGSVTVLNPLPIVVNNFEAVKNGNNVDLSWSVSNNNKINYFEIWTSTNAENFVLLETVKASNKHLTSKDYFTIDKSPEIGVNYYKLKVVDVNGRITFSEIKSVSFDLNNSIYIFPNPVELGKDVYVNLQLIDENEIVEVSIVDQIGKIILNNSYKGQKSIYFNTANLAKGVYFVKVKSKNELVSQRIIVI